MNQRNKNRHKKVLLTVATLVGTTGAFLGCSGAGQSETEVASAKDGTIVVDGKTFEPLGADWTSNARGTGVDSYGSADDPDGGAKPTNVADRSESELAEDLRPILGRDGKLYRASEPATDLARALKRGESLGNHVAGGSASKQLYAPVDDSLHTDFLFNPGNPGHPQSTDYRTADDINSWPSRTVVFLAATAPDGAKANCTGTYVGAHTLITSAHCVRLNGHSYGMNIVFTPGARGTNGVPTTMPFGQYNGCYDWWYPTAWDTTGDESYDYAVIDFRRCGNPTINRTGWMGVQENANSFPAEREDGYPGPYTVGSDGVDNAAPLGTGTPGCGRTANPSGFYPFLCGSSGPAETNDYRLESDTLNDTPGDSGGPWWQWYSNHTDPRVDAVASGYRSYFDFLKCGFDNCYRNYGHLVDTNYWNFIVAHSEIGH